jgi:hypothetical protein
MTEIHRAVIDDASAWTPRSLGGKEGLVYTLGTRHLDAIDQILGRVKHLKTDEIAGRDFDHPALNPFLADLRREIMNGKCAVIIRGIDVARYSQGECEKIFWGFGNHWGNPAIQSSRADRIGYVRNEPDDPIKRGYRSSRELVLHSDARAIIALMSLQAAETGGVTHLASGATIHNVIFREHPELLEPLYRGFPYSTKEFQSVGQPVTLYSVPIFSKVDDVVSCMFFESFMRAAAAKLGGTLPDDLDRALTCFAQVAQRDDVHIEFMLDPGEIMVCNNFAVLHARTQFQNSETKERLLLRLLLNVPNGRKLVPELLQRGHDYDKLFDPRYKEFA